MPSDVHLLNEIISSYTISYRKDAEMVKEKDVGSLHVVEIMGYPEAPSHGMLVDVHFIKIGFTEASADVESFREALKQALNGKGEFCDIDQKRLSDGPSYIEVGGWLGSQDLALRLFALLAHYKMGTVITPATLGVSGDEADDLAGRGLIMGQLTNIAASP